MKAETLKFGKYHLKLLKKNDVEKYYRSGFEESDEEANYYTGTTSSFAKDQIVAYVNRVVEDSSRYDFLIMDSEKIIGEVVLSEIENKNCHYRICIFNKEHFSKGIGYDATVKVLEFAFTELGLETVELEVFPFNERGIALYKKLGFIIIGKIIDEEAKPPYKDIVIMKLNSYDFLQ